MIKFLVLSTLCAAGALATHGILLVSDQVDGVANPQLFDSYYEKAVEAAGYTYAKWNHAVRGEVPFEEMRKYKVIIWYTSTSGDAPASDPLRGSLTLTPNEQANLVAFLSQTPGTTTVMLSGMYFAWNCVADATTETQLYKPLFSDYLKLQYPAANFTQWIKVEDDWKIVGEPSCPILKGQTYTLNWRHFTTWPDQLEPASGGAASAWWEDRENRRYHRAVIRAEGTKPNGGRYRVVLFSCPFENILHEQHRKTVMKNFLAWAGTSEVGVTPSSLGRVKTLFY